MTPDQIYTALVWKHLSGEFKLNRLNDPRWAAWLFWSLRRDEQGRLDTLPAYLKAADTLYSHGILKFSIGGIEYP